MFPENLLEAAGHLRWLLDRGYPQTASVKLVGDRHRIDKAGRQILARGISATAECERRSELIVPPGAGVPGRLGIDGHNAALTVANYIAGVPVFEACDGLIRDIGALHGRLHDEDLMRRSLGILADALEAVGAEAVFAVFDAPLSHSRDHAAFFRGRLTAAGLQADVEAVPSGDRALIDAKIDSIATSDSALVDAVGLPVVDLARVALDREFRPEYDSLVPSPAIDPQKRFG
jgi:hypothetical protein